MEWWNELTGLQRFFAMAAIPATIIMIVQFILLLFGFGHGVDADGVDADGTDAPADVQDYDGFDSDPDDLTDVQESDQPIEEAHENADALRLFSLRSIIAFFSVGGWMGVAAIDWNLPGPLAFVLAFAAGTLALYFVAWSIREALRLQQSGNIVLENAVGHIGEVYIPIPEAGKGTGKVSVMVQERLGEYDALTEAGRELKTGEKVTVEGVTPEGVLLVSPKNSPPEGVIIEKDF